MFIKYLFIFLTVNVDFSLHLQCHTTKETKCRWNSTCQYEIEVCNEKSSTNLGGFYCVTLINSLNDVTIEQMGCMYDQETTKQCQNQSRCLMKFTSSEKKYLHCCCDKDLCNFNLDLSKPNIESDKIGSLTSTENDDQQKNCSSKFFCRNFSLALICLTSFILTLFIFICSMMICRRKSLTSNCSRFIRKGQTQFSTIEEKIRIDLSSTPLLTSNDTQNKRLDLNQIEISKKLLKNGRSSKVFTGFYKNSPVAIKSFESDPSRVNSIESIFEHEKDIFLLPNMEHENLVKFYGYASKEKSFYLLFDYADQGSLRDYLRLNRIDEDKILIEMLTQISNGVEYLHKDFRSTNPSNRSSIAHRDLKTENILRYSTGRLVICDFAMSIQLNENNLTSFDHQQVGTARYMAPEILAGTISNDVNALLRCDVYSLGLVFWEIVSRYSKIEGTEQYKMPYESQLIEKNFNRNPSIEEMLQIINSEPPFDRPLILRSWRNSTKINEILLTMEQCWHSIPEGRINVSLVAHRIKKIQ